jgi:hypothetical protein
MKFEELFKDINETLKIIGTKKDNDLFPWKIERVIILPTVDKNNYDIVRRIMSSSSLKQALIGAGVFDNDLDFYVYSNEDGVNKWMLLSHYKSL